jgi:hypothetical protein
VLSVGTWLLALPDPADAGTELGRSGPQPHPPHYRLADGGIVTLEKPLTPIQAQPLIASQPVAALTAYRTTEIHQ